MGTDIHGFLQIKESNGWKNIGAIPRGRNYILFAVLADVRNGFEFAGVETHEPVNPISAPRGLPPDSPGGYFGDHSYSWLSIKEVLEYGEWSRVLKETGVLSKQEYENWGGEGVPGSWCGDIVGGWVKVTNDLSEKDWTHIRVVWESRTLKDACRKFWLWLEYLKQEFAWEIEDDSLRMVFGFDS